MDRRISRRAILAAPFVLTLTSCLTDDEDPTPTAAGATPTTARPQRTVVLPTTDGQPTATSTPRASPVPEATATETQTPESAPEATPTATHVEVLSPLTGQPVIQTVEKPFAVQIDNAVEARPQTGIYRADIVYESPTEAGVTRFTALFGSDLPYDIGPVRSLRQVTLETIPAHDAILVYSGASIDMTQALFASGIPAIHAEGNGIAASRRDDERQAPHNLYVAGPRLKDVVEAVRIDAGSHAPSLEFGSHPTGGERTVGISISLPVERVDWIYDMRARGYIRYVNGEPHRDRREDDAYVIAQNVVVVRAPFTFMDFVDDPGGEQPLGATLTGEGPATLLRDGYLFEARWRRSSVETPFRLTDANAGRNLPMKPGQTWYTIVPDWLPEATAIPEEDGGGVLP